MTRAKVPSDKRQRIASACEPCKRRKQKCNGQQPCSACSRRSDSCVFTNDNEGRDTSQALTSRRASHVSEKVKMQPQSPSNSANIVGARQTGTDQSRDHDHGSCTGGDEDDEEEEADNHTMTRLLEDSHGRLVYVGDSATLSFLQLLRMIVETVAGPSMFTSDPSRHRIVETSFATVITANLSHLLPTEATANILVDAFFTHTHAFLDLFDEDTFMKSLDRSYSAPMDLDTKWIAKLHLILAIGMCLAIPSPGSQEDKIIADIRRRFPHQSETYYLVSGRTRNALDNLDEADLWTIQMLILMAFYMLLRTRRSTAYAYIGIAIRTAYALGLHRDETLVIFPDEEQLERQRLWRSLFIFDRFMSVSLGRPLAIAADMTYGDMLNPPSRITKRPGHTEPTPQQLRDSGHAASIQSAHVMGAVLSQIYQEGKISTKVAQRFSDLCKKWPEELPPELHWRNAKNDNIRTAITILNCNMMYGHSIVLLTRPFFLFLLSSEMQQSQVSIKTMPPTSRGKIARFSDACILTSFHTIALAQHAHHGGYLPRLNPLVSYCVFTCGLIVAANEFARPGKHPTSTQHIQQAISILAYCGTLDPHARETAGILEQFSEVIEKQARKAERQPNQVQSSQSTSFIGNLQQPGSAFDQSEAPMLADAGPRNLQSTANLPRDQGKQNYKQNSTMPSRPQAQSAQAQMPMSHACKNTTTAASEAQSGIYTGEINSGTSSGVFYPFDASQPYGVQGFQPQQAGQNLPPNPTSGASPPNSTVNVPLSVSAFPNTTALMEDQPMPDFLDTTVNLLPDATVSSSNEDQFFLDELRQWPFFNPSVTPGLPDRGGSSGMDANDATNQDLNEYLNSTVPSQDTWEPAYSNSKPGSNLNPP